MIQKPIGNKHGRSTVASFHDSRLLVTGAADNLGAGVLEQLAARGARHVTAGSRDPARTRGPAEARMRVDFDDAASLAAAFRAIERVLIISTDALDEPGERGRQHVAAIRAAAAASAVLGKPIEVVQVADEALAGGMRAADLPEPLVGLMVAFGANTRAGFMNVVSDAAQRLSGRLPQALRDGFAAHRSAFAG
ncbi:MAG: hypothetical protein ABT02_19125 [Comamonadaceae bacterium SCN 68-20]|nr:MAG: hypothetical protein ABT02_19125 [Comamonadaceae bacterium SCN 68-20]